MKTKIPKIIHLVWFGGQLPDKEKYCIESWSTICPDYEIKIWNEETFDINSNQYVKEAYECKKYAFVSDYVRLYALYHCGGIYLDTDVELFRNFDEFLNYDFFTSFENMSIIVAAVTGATKNNEIIGELLKQYENRSFFTDANKTKMDLTPNVFPITIFLKHFVGFEVNNTRQEKIYKGMNCLLLPTEYYFPQDYVTKEIKMTKNTHGIHIYSSSWITKKMKFQDNCALFARKLLGEKLFRKCEKKYLDAKVNKIAKATLK